MYDIENHEISDIWMVLCSGQDLVANVNMVAHFGPGRRLLLAANKTPVSYRACGALAPDRGWGDGVDGDVVAPCLTPCRHPPPPRADPDLDGHGRGHDGARLPGGVAAMKPGKDGLRT